MAGYREAPCSKRFLRGGHKKDPDRFLPEGLGASGGAVRRMRTSLHSPSPGFRSGREKATPLCESGGAGLFVGLAVLAVTLRRKMVVDRGMD